MLNISMKLFLCIKIRIHQENLGGSQCFPTGRLFLRGGRLLNFGEQGVWEGAETLLVTDSRYIEICP